MKSLLKLSMIAVVILMFSSCGKKNRAGKMVPQNAIVVAQIELKSLGNKLSWKEIQQTDIYKKMISDSSVNGWKKSLMENPSSSGIDFDAGITVFTADHNGNKYLAAEGKIKNQKDFDQFNKNFSDGNATPSGDVHILNLRNKGVVGWKNNQFIYLMNHENKMMNMGHWNDSTSQQNRMPTADRTAEFTALCKNLFSLKTDSSLANNDRFGSLLNENGDIHVYQNTDAMLNNAPQMGPLSMLKLDAFLKGNASTYTINFDNGKIDVSQKMFVSKQLTDIVKKYLGNSIEMDMVKRIPSNNLLGLMTVNFKPQGVTEMIKLTGMDGMINSYTQPMGFNLDDFSKATNGNWLLAFTDLNITDSMKNSSFNYIFSAGINDKAELQKMLNAAKKTTADMGKDSVLNYVMNDKLFAQSNHTSFANEYLNGNSNTSFDFANKISGHPAAFYLDLHKLLSQFTSVNTTKPGRKEMLDESLKIWNNIVSTGGEFNNGGFTFNTEVSLINKDSNSLQQLKNYFNNVFLIHEKTKADVPDVRKRLDSMLLPPPVDTVR